MATADASKAEANKAFIREFVERYTGKPKSDEAMREYASSETFITLSGMFEAAFPAYEVFIEDMIAEGDKVVVRAILSGTHQAEFAGIPPTGRRIETPFIGIYRLESGKIAEVWLQFDSAVIMQQLSGEA